MAQHLANQKLLMDSIHLDYYFKDLGNKECSIFVKSKIFQMISNGHWVALLIENIIHIF